MGSNNFTIHNPEQANQEADDGFASDSLTTGGIGTDAILPSKWLNARWYEDSVMGYCLAQMLANKGYNVNKDDPTQLTTVLANLLTSADSKTPLIVVNYTPTPTFDASLANGFDITLAGDVVSSTLISTSIGQLITFIVTQDGNGNHQFVPPANVNGWQPVKTAPNAVTVQQFIVKEDGTLRPVRPSLTSNKAIVTGSASFGAVRRNDSQFPMWVTVTASVGSGGAVATVYSDASPAPTTPIAAMSRVAASDSNPSYPVSVSFIVDPGNFYVVNQANGNTGPFVINYWIEDILSLV